MPIGIDGSTVVRAQQFDTNLANRLSDGVVSDVDVREAAQIVQNLRASGPARNAWGQTNFFAVRNWQQQVTNAQVLYQQVNSAYQMQDPQLTQAETQKDMQNPSGYVPGQNLPGVAPQYVQPQFVQPPNIQPGYADPNLYYQQTPGQVIGEVAGAAVGFALLNNMMRNNERREFRGEENLFRRREYGPVGGWGHGHR